MENIEERPRAGDPPKLTEPLPILKELLGIERQRLVVALEIEQKRDVVFPETTVIVRDIERLLTEVVELESGQKIATTKPPVKPKKKNSRVLK